MWNAWNAWNAGTLHLLQKIFFRFFRPSQPKKWNAGFSWLRSAAFRYAHKNRGVFPGQTVILYQGGIRKIVHYLSENCPYARARRFSILVLASNANVIQFAKSLLGSIPSPAAGQMSVVDDGGGPGTEAQAERACPRSPAKQYALPSQIIIFITYKDSIRLSKDTPLKCKKSPFSFDLTDFSAYLVRLSTGQTKRYKGRFWPKYGIPPAGGAHLSDLNLYMQDRVERDSRSIIRPPGASDRDPTPRYPPGGVGCPVWWAWSPVAGGHAQKPVAVTVSLYRRHSFLFCLFIFHPFQQIAGLTSKHRAKPIKRGE